MFNLKQNGIVLLIIVSTSMLAFQGCDKNPTGPPTSEQDINTAGYAKTALNYNSSTGKYEFFSWKGTSSNGGCRIYINVHDGTSNVPSGSNLSAAKRAVISARNRWKAAIEEAGITVSSVTRFESEGDEMLSNIPRIDIYYVSTVDSDNSKGSALALINRTDLSYRGSTIRIRSNLTESQLDITTNHEFGHALGIYNLGSGLGHSNNSNDAMYTPSKYSTLTNGDKATIRTIYQGTAFYKPYAVTSSSTGSITVRHSASYPYDVTVLVNRTQYKIDPGKTVTISGISSSSVLKIWECVSPEGGWDCSWDSYTISKGKNYKVVDGSGGNWDMKLLYN